MKYFVTRREDRRLDPHARQELRGSFVRLSDGVTHYELAGPEDGDLVVLAGGLTVPLFYWDRLAAELQAQGLRTLAYSGYGRGYSDRLRVPHDEDLFVRQLTHLVAHLDLTGPHHLIGTSMGALIAMAYAQTCPDSLSTLTIVGPAGLLDEPSLRKRLLASDRLTGLVAKYAGHRLLEGHLGHNVKDPERAAELAAMVLGCYEFEGSMFGFFSTLQNLPLSGRSDLYARTGDLGVPTLLIWGADDQVTPIKHLDRTRALLRPSDCYVIRDCGHMAPLERPHEVAAHLASFLSSSTETLDS